MDTPKIINLKKINIMTELLTQRIKEAMLNKNASELKTLRLIKAEFTKAEKDGVVIDNVSSFKILNKMMTQREESYNQYVAANRVELANAEKEEMDIIATFIPKQPSEGEIKEFVVNTINDYIKSQGEGFKVSMRDMKPILTKVQETYPTVNGKIVSEVIKSMI